MTDLIKEEFLTTIKKKRFIFLTAILFIFAVVDTVTTKNDNLNDLTYMLSKQDYLWSDFSPFMGLILIFSMYRKQYTRASFLQVENRGMKRSSGVIARFISGSLILICCYALMALFLILLGFVFGAHCTAQQYGILVLMLATDCLAAIVSYMSALFFLYLCPLFSIPALIWYGVIMYYVPDLMLKYTGYKAHSLSCFFIPRSAMDNFCTGLILSNIKWQYLLILVPQFLVPFLLTLMVFKLKKIKEKKPRKKKGGAEDDTSEDDETAAVIAATTLI